MLPATVVQLVPTALKPGGLLPAQLPVPVHNPTRHPPMLHATPSAYPLQLSVGSAHNPPEHTNVSHVAPVQFVHGELSGTALLGDEMRHTPPKHRAS